MRHMFLVLLAGALVGCAQAEEPFALRVKAPELKGINEWVNSKPLTLSELKGKVVVLHFWTFG